MILESLPEFGSREKHMLSVPITQHITFKDKERFEGKSKIGIKCSKLSDELLAVISEPVFFENRREEIATRVFGTFGKTHPKVERILAQGEFLISGKSNELQATHVETS